MRRTKLVLLTLAAALVAGGCSSQETTVAAGNDPQPVRLGGGDSIGQQLFRDVPEFAVACATPHDDVATADAEQTGDR
jgi:hypothetical protein